MYVRHCLNLTTYVTYPADLPVARPVQSALPSRPTPHLPFRHGLSRTTWLQDRKSTCQQRYCPQTRCVRRWSQVGQMLFWSPHLVLPLPALSGKRIFGIDPSNSVERKLAPFLQAHVPTARLTFGNSDTALTTSLMRSGKGGVLVEARGAQTDFGTCSYVHVPLVGEDAPYWEVGVSFHADSPSAAISCDFAQYAREKIALE